MPPTPRETAGGRALDEALADAARAALPSTGAAKVGAGPGSGGVAGDGGPEQVGSRPLGVLIVDEDPRGLEETSRIVTRLGHRVVPRDRDAGGVAVAAAVDVAIVVLGPQGQSLETIGRIARSREAPVVALVTASAPERMSEAARRGAFACVVDADEARLSRALEIALRRFADYRSLQDAFVRRALVEQAKGILMARHAIDDGRADRLLHAHARRTDRGMLDVAKSIVDSHALLIHPFGGATWPKA